MSVKKIKSREGIFIAQCLGPALILTIIFMLVPLMQGLKLSFTDATATSIGGKYIGFDNYIYMFQDKNFYQALWNTIKLLIVIPFMINLFGLLLGFLVTQVKLREKGLYRFLFFFPSVISATALGVLWSNIYSPTMGIVQKIGEIFGIEALQGTAILGNSKTVLIAVGITMVWQSAGYYMVMYIAAIDGIDTSVYEAAKLDGCGVWKRIFLITVPMLKDMIGVTFVLSISSVISMSYIITSVMTAGGPAGSSTVLLYYMYDQAFQLSNFGYAMSIAVFTLVFAFILSFLSRKVAAKNQGSVK